MSEEVKNEAATETTAAPQAEREMTKEEKKAAKEAEKAAAAAAKADGPAKDSIQAATDAGEVIGRPQAGSYPEDKMISCGMSVANIAELCHEANRAHCQIHGDNSQKPWVQAPEWQRKSAIEGVLNILRHRHPSPGMSHSNWMKSKAKDGWVYGATKDEKKKTHPCMVAFGQLPPHQQAKDHLFYGIVMGFKKSE